MIHLLYKGNHDKDTWLVRFGWWLTRRMQRGEFKQITHTEVILAGDNYKRCSIASASVRDGGVRIKENLSLTKGNWLAYEVAKFDAARSRYWFEAHVGEKYNIVAAAATKLTWFQGIALGLAGWFCNWSCLASCGLLGAYKETPSQSCERLVREHGAVDVTEQFFKD
jgi:hypothetical protein